MRDEWLTSEQGIKCYKQAGLSENTFFRHVREGKIKKSLAIGRERGAMYDGNDIRKIADAQGEHKKKSVIASNGPRDTLIEWVQVNDVPATVALDFLLYQETTIADINQYAAWVRKNPYISLAAFDAKDRRTVLSYIALLPLPENVILDILRNDRAEMDIKAEEIKVYSEPGPYSLLVESAAAHPDHPEQLGKVMKTLTDFWYRKFPEQYIEKIYARPVSDKGDILLQKLYFAARYDLSETAFMLDLRRPGASRFIQHFQARLEAKSRALGFVNPLRKPSE